MVWGKEKFVSYIRFYQDDVNNLKLFLENEADDET